MTNLSDKLKEATKRSHALLEKEFVGHIKSVSSITDYAHLLSVFYGFFKPLEDAIESKIDTLTMPDIVHRRKSDWLLKDISQLSKNFLDDLAVCDNIPTITSHADAIGAMYVMEGSTLGGNIIRQMISAKLGNVSENTFSFFSGYGEETKSKWAAFKKTLDETPVNEEANVISAAEQTFEKFRNWIIHYGGEK